jgi:hypothetical protein
MSKAMKLRAIFGPSINKYIVYYIKTEYMIDLHSCLHTCIFLPSFFLSLNPTFHTPYEE